MTKLSVILNKINRKLEPVEPVYKEIQRRIQDSLKGKKFKNQEEFSKYLETEGKDITEDIKKEVEDYTKLLKGMDFATFNALISQDLSQPDNLSKMIEYTKENKER